MIILMLDDQDERHIEVEKLLGKAHTILHAFNAPEAIEILSGYNGRIGLAMLDHDLMDFVEENNRKYERDGMWFINNMMESVPTDKHPARFVVHSWNIERAKKMTDALQIHGFYASNQAFSIDMIKHLAMILKDN